MFSTILNFAKGKLSSIIGKASIADVTKIAEKTTKKGKQEIVVEKKRKDPKWQSCFPFTFFYGNGKLQPIYFFVTLFSSLSAWMLWVKIHAASIAVRNGTFTPEMINTGDLGVVLGFIGSLILLYNNNKKTYVPTSTSEEAPPLNKEDKPIEPS